jgi:ATP-binding protein involved in chromosome partitioning
MSSIPATPSSPALFPFGSPDKFHRAARELDAPVLGDLPIASGVSEGGDSGRPVVISGEGGESEETIRKVMKGVAEGVWGKLER